MTLEEYVKKYDTTYTAVALAIGKPIRTVTYWAVQGYIVKTKGKELLRIFKPTTTVWESESNKARSAQLGVDQ